MMGLTPRLAELKAYIGDFQSDHGFAPSLSEMADAIGVTSKSGIHRMLNELEERGHIRRARFLARSIEIVREDDPLSSTALSRLSLESLTAIQASLSDAIRQARRAA